MRVLSGYAEIDHTGPLSSELVLSLKILRHRVVTAALGVVKSGRRAVWHIYTGACFEKGRKAGIGGALVNEAGGIVKHFGTFLSDDQTDQIDKLEHATIIAELGMLAVWVGIQLFHDDIVDNDLVFFCDNNAVLSSLISGRMSNLVMRAILQKVFEWEDDHGMNIWYERVESHANIADGPSRGFFEGLQCSKETKAGSFMSLRGVEGSWMDVCFSWYFLCTFCLWCNECLLQWNMSCWMHFSCGIMCTCVNLRELTYDACWISYPLKGGWLLTSPCKLIKEKRKITVKCAPYEVYIYIYMLYVRFCISHFRLVGAFSFCPSVCT